MRRMLGESLRYFLQHRVIGSGCLISDMAGHQSIQGATERVGPIFAGAVTTLPEIHEERVILVGLAFRGTIILCDAGLLAGEARRLCGLLGRLSLPDIVGVLFQLGPDPFFLRLRMR